MIFKALWLWVDCLGGGLYLMAFLLEVIVMQLELEKVEKKLRVSDSQGPAEWP